MSGGGTRTTLRDLTDVRPDPRPSSGSGGIGLRKHPGERRFRHVADASEWARIRQQKLGPCLVCLWLGETQQHASSIHHVVAKSLGGDDCAKNAVSVCGHGTVGHHGLLEAHDEADLPGVRCGGAAVRPGRVCVRDREARRGRLAQALPRPLRGCRMTGLLALVWLAVELAGGMLVIVAAGLTVGFTLTNAPVRGRGR